MKPPHPQPPHPDCLHHHHSHLDTIRLRKAVMFPKRQPPAESSRCSKSSKSGKASTGPHHAIWQDSKPKSEQAACVKNRTDCQTQTRPKIHRRNQTKQEPARSENHHHQQQRSETNRSQNQSKGTGRSRKPTVMNRMNLVQNRQFNERWHLEKYGFGHTFIFLFLFLVRRFVPVPPPQRDMVVEEGEQMRWMDDRLDRFLR